MGPSSSSISERPAPINDDANAPTSAIAPAAADDPAPDDAEVKPSPPSCAGLVVCDDFEAEAPGSPPSPARWTVMAAKGDRVEVDATRAKWGSQSLKISARNREYGRTMLVNTTAFPASPNQIFGRLHFYIDLETMPANHIDLISAHGTLPGQNKITTLSYGSQFRLFLANYYNDANPGRVLDLWQHAGVAKGSTWQDATYVPTRRWTCLEWLVSGDGNQMQMWLDGQPVPRLHVDGVSPTCCPDKPWTVPPLADVAMGWAFIPLQDGVPVPPVAMWLDGVALDKARIGCDR